jgi:hypothetical protein
MEDEGKGMPLETREGVHRWMKVGRVSAGRLIHVLASGNGTSLPGAFCP